MHYGRFLDNVIGVWKEDPENPNAWNNFLADFKNYGALRWTNTGLKRSLVFLDFTVTITNKNNIEFASYSKPMNLHIYIPPHSVHPPGVTQGTIFGLIKTYWQTNTKHSDFIHHASQLYQRFVRRGYSPTLLNTLFTNACDKLKPISNLQREDYRRNIFFRLQYHPKGINRTHIRRAYDQTIKRILPNIRLTVAISRPKHLRDKLC